MSGLEELDGILSSILDWYDTPYSCTVETSVGNASNAAQSIANIASKSNKTLASGWETAAGFYKTIYNEVVTELTEIHDVIHQFVLASSADELAALEGVNASNEAAEAILAGLRPTNNN